MKRIGVYLSVVLIILVGCTENNENQNSEDVPELIKVNVEMNPQDINANTEVIIKAKVTQGNDVVDDADEVKFEIWKEGQSDQEHVKIDGEYDSEAEVYFIKKTFNEPGQYFVISHVTARRMHNMPKVQFEVK
ncbi:FixH family protein [Peribacillus acanthi]|uniref:FixH family protein n=1 Tax=Peribacillus acanthi TaxID=2171554 RepID=UPI000D3ED184|nr:FixH family protein [Peribacillus acanthi]